jgi:PhzF family phenazine biosynthesis protein
MTGTLLRLAAFTTDPGGGNPAGVWIGDALPADGEMQRIAAQVGYSETAFLAPDGTGATGRFRVRYFSPLAEVPFCGHATIAAGVALAELGLAAPPGTEGEPSRIELTTNGGAVAVSTDLDEGGHIRATLTTVATWAREPEPELLEAAMAMLGWHGEELDPGLPPAVGFAGAKHLILAARDLSRLARLEYPFEPLQTLMLEHDLTTIQLVCRESRDRFRARDPFPVGGVVEDPATGAAAAALGAYLRARGEITPPASFEIVQGVEMGRPSRLTVSIVPGEDGVRVSGNAVTI